MPDKETNLVLFTDSFPFRSFTEEVFVYPELEALAKRFKRVIIVPHRVTGKQTEINIPNVIVDTTMANSLSTRFKPLRLPWLFNSWVLSQVPAVLKETRNPGKVLSAMFYLMNTRRSAKQIKQVLRHNNLNSESTLLYSFWFDFVTDAFTFFNSYKAVTRAHGHDVFDSEIKHRLHYLRQLSLSTLSAVYCASNDGRQYIAQSYPKYKAKISTKLLGTIPPGAQSPAPQRDSDIITLLSCARVAPEKRVHLCLESAIAVASAFPFKTVQWIHIGDGVLMNDLRNKIHTSRATLPTNLHIELKGALPNNKVRQFYETTAIDWLMLFSSTEGLPIAITEALSYGVPVIATNVGGISEIVNSECGILLPAQFDPMQIAGELQPFISDYDAYLELRNAAYHQWNKKFNALTLRSAFADELQNITM
ncbi:MAG: glycosyltransferase [Muribaculum sp.]|nr:glycosyltransferase [Muribaculaceae bacterium]MCM1081379.1 glycosyltransferase [Muribaculum sp.]